MQQSRTAGTGKISLTTGERFLKITLGERRRKRSSSISRRRVINGDQEFGIARDVQLAAKGSPLITRFSPGKAQKLTLYFEVPPEVVRKA